MDDIQVSLDSLWTFRKLREEGNGEPGEEPSVFDRESLRALPLGLGLHYTSLTENQRAKIARRYAQQARPVAAAPSVAIRSDQDGSDAQQRSSSCAAVSLTRNKASAHGPPAPAGTFSSAGSGVGVGVGAGVPGGGGLLSPSSNRPSPHLQSLLSPPPQGLDEGVSSAAVEDGQGTPRLPGEDDRSAVVASSSTPRSGELHLLSLSQVDHDVLDCLPQEVREEVLRTIASNTVSGSGATTAGGGGGGGVAGQSDCRSHDGSTNPDEGLANEADTAVLPAQEETVVDVCSPSVPSPSLSQQEELRQPRQDDARKKDGDRGMFEVESVGTLRGALRVWVGGAVRSPSQWHVELLYR